ncbi:hypothetical protein B0T26DRAFT_735028 [Lasiosphaeria miniovina]|uniref:Uncharacterized protein n=1 Tax=Lasiosphaeria miniovina TaxID=1954250 RepID=A0AA40DFT7_9PEZI|nr:uncharacterized protein B0T26DRAFT_735028 [Lasiosphaeria miniovina]KAK0701869.1 hypothetical protein B0T26DRAFT_735028 [Lasiosphaeria miniovina]
MKHATAKVMAVSCVLAAVAGASRGRWWASIAITDTTDRRVRPSDLIPAGIDSTGDLG